MVVRKPLNLCSTPRQAGRRLTVLTASAALALFAACTEEVAPAPRAVRTVPATVLTVRTNIPGQRSFAYVVAMQDQKVRIGSETDQWRLFDLRARSVTFVDDIARTYRTRPMNDIIRERTSLLARDLPPGIPRAQIESLSEAKTFAGIPASGFLITMGGYKRELWISQRVLLAPDFLAMYTASEPISTPFAPVMREVHEQLSTMRGFPVHDRSEMPYGNGTLVIERTVQKLEQRDVPARWFQVPPQYRDLTASPSPSAGRPRASSNRPGPTAPATE